ncbi:MAG: hypothetical protein AABX62_01255 [Thermoproteota archaeon]
MKNETYDKRIHVLIFESESHSAIQELLRSVSKVLPPNVNILNYQVDDSLFRVVLASLREGVSLTGFGKNRGGR